MALFEAGRQKTGGRRRGSRDRIATALLEAIAEDFEKFGFEAVKIARKERPVECLRVVASLLPKEFEITDNRLKDIPDDELDAFIGRFKVFKHLNDWWEEFRLYHRKDG